MSNLTRLLVAVGMLLAMATVTGCGPNAPERPADEVVALMRASMAEQTSYRFNHESMGPGTSDAGSGEWLAPDYYHATQLGAEVILVGRTMYFRAQGSQTWRSSEVPEGRTLPSEGIRIMPLENASVHHGRRRLPSEG